MAFWPIVPFLSLKLSGDVLCRVPMYKGAAPFLLGAFH